MGYPAEDLPTRPRYPLDFALFEERYPKFSQEQIERAMRVMDKGFLAEDYCRRLSGMIDLETKREERFNYETYSCQNR